MALLLLTSCADPGVFTAADCGSEPTLIKKVDPVYPRFSRQAGLEGDVILTYIVDVSGIVKDVKVIRGDSKSFEDAAVRAVSQYKYSPAICYGRPVESEVTTTIEFRLT